jgi:hypothetical protein
MKCGVCRGAAVIDLPRHNANFCTEHFRTHCREQQCKEMLNSLEVLSPGAKHVFYHGFLERMAPAITERSLAERGALGAGEGCGGPTPSDVCAFCRLVERTAR